MLKLFLKLGKWCIQWRSAQLMPFFVQWEILEPFISGPRNTLMKPCSKKGSRIFDVSLSYDGSLFTSSLYTCLSTASSLLRCPLVLLLRWLVVACCVASIAGIFTVHLSFVWFLCLPPSLASSCRHHQENTFNTNIDVSVSRQLASGHWSNETGAMQSCWREDGATRAGGRRRNQC